MSQLNKQHLKWASIAEARLKDAFPTASLFIELRQHNYASGTNHLILHISVVEEEVVNCNFRFYHDTNHSLSNIHLTIKDIVSKLKEELNAKVNKQNSPVVGSIPAEPIQCTAVDIWQSSTAANDSEYEDNSEGSGVVEDTSWLDGNGKEIDW